MGERYPELGRWKEMTPENSRTLPHLLFDLFSRRSSQQHSLHAVEKTKPSPLSESDFADHVAGGCRRGVIPFVSDTHVGWACIDFDFTPHDINPDDPAAHEMVGHTLEELGHRKLAGWAERSKSKGWHIWMFFETPTEAAAVRVVLADVVRKATSYPIGADTICPRRDRRGVAGNGMWLPLFGGDDVPCTRFVIPLTFAPEPDQAEVLRKIIESLNRADLVHQLAAALPTASTAAKADAPAAPLEGKIRAGERNTKLTSFAGTLRRKGFSGEEIVEMLLAVNRNRCEPPLQEAEVRKIARNIVKHEPEGSMFVEAAPDAGIVRLSDVKRECVRWLWVGRVPRAKLTIIDGDPNWGKSLLTIDLAARVSTGRKMPDGTPGTLGNVLMVSLEDGLGDTIAPRLDAAGADTTRIVARDPDHPFVIPRDLDWLEARIGAEQAALVVIDPLMAVLDSRRNANSDQQVRTMLGPLAALAQRTGAAVVVVRHWNKKDGSALQRGGGSMGIIGQARAAFLVAPSKHDPELRVLAMTKINVGPRRKSLGFRVVGPENGPGHIEWVGEVDETADDLVEDSQVTRARAAKREDAKTWLRELLAEGPVKVQELWARVDAAGIARITVRRASDELGVIKDYDNELGAHAWRLPTPGENPKKPIDVTKLIENAKKRVAA